MKNKIRYMGGIVSQSSAVDQTTRALSVFNVVDEITIELKAKDPSIIIANSVEKVVLPINVQVISLWKRSNLSDHEKEVGVKIEVEFLDPIGVSVNKTLIDARIPTGMKRTRNILSVNGLVITRTGEYPIQFREVLENGQKSDVLATLILDIIVNKS